MAATCVLRQITDVYHRYMGQQHIFPRRRDVPGGVDREKFSSKRLRSKVRSYQREPDRAIRDNIQEHMTEFIPAGLDLAVAVQGPSVPAPQSEEARNQRKKERGFKLRWAYDTLVRFHGWLCILWPQQAW
jgi:hypothetical protein